MSGPVQILADIRAAASTGDVELPAGTDAASISSAALRDLGVVDCS